MRCAASEISSTHDVAYGTLYRQCIRIIPELADVFPKPEPVPEPMQDAPSQRTSHSRHEPPTPSSSARVASPPALDLVASAPTAPVPPPVPATALDLVARAPVLSDVAPPTTSPSSLPTLSRPRGPRRMLTTTMSLASAAPEPICLSSVPPSPAQGLPEVQPPPAQNCQISVSPLPVLCRPISVSPPLSARSQSNSVSPPLQAHQVSPPPPIQIQQISTPSARSTVSPHSPPGLPPAPGRKQTSPSTRLRPLL